ncbi:hypothetical protein G4B88_011448 [Cannabis sativa]|uniref:Fe2OG dioxygenase domain-containing protein n=1 Tax=Cannabis sativa TaxID=3483 RepID=A0A7J6DLP8_CANSA|nr:hypothetical protein G4B88_011448 [Cannabis sativa]
MEVDPAVESEPEIVNFGKSIIVPSVQELAKLPLLHLPPRYCHCFQQSPINSNDPLSIPSIPIIDLHRLGTTEFTDSEVQRLHSACREWGFFQVINHGISTSLLDKFRTEVENFFKLPYEEKKRLWQHPDNHEGFGQLFVVSEEQKLDWSDIDTMEAYSMEVKKLAMVILDHMAKALKMDGEEMRDLFGEGVQSIRMNYYPPCPEPDLAIGFTPHSDADALTILFQLNDTEGLQIRKDGNWVSVTPLPNALVVNIGDVMEIVSNGTYKSIEHRATVNSSKERLSVATFYSSKLDSELGPALSIIGPENPAIFRRVPIENYFKEFFARKLSEINKLGSSIPVPLVQELAKEIGNNKNKVVPLRYQHPNQDSIIYNNTTFSSSSSNIPIIHFNKLVSSDKSTMESELQKLHLASKDWGFFQLVDHGVSPLLVENVKEMVEEFFNMGIEEKNKFRQQIGDLEGLGQAFVVSEDQKLDWADMFFLVTLPKHLRKPHLLPKLPLPFRETIEAYSIELENIAKKVLDLMGKALGMKPNEMSELFGEGWQTMRMNYYPPCPQPELVIGLNAHSDSIGLTILLQINETEVYRSIEHRATVNAEKERLSIGTFYGPSLYGDIGPAPSLVTPKTPAQFKTIRVEDYFRKFFALELRENKSEEIKLGGSLPVPLVQELAKEIYNNNKKIVPQRYQRPDQDHAIVINTSSSSNNIPIIHFNNLFSSHKFTMESELQKLHLASKHWGFFQLVDHGVSPLLMENVKSRIKEFFNMPIEEKNKFRQQSGELEGLGQAFVVCEEQKLEWADMFYIVTQPNHLRKSHLLPKLPLPFRETLEAYSTELENVAKKVFDFMGKALGMEPNEMNEVLGEGWQSMRMNYYPPCPQPELVIGLNPHSDPVGLTILLQINETEGLQIKKDGVWIPIKPLPNAFIVNIGDMTEIITNGIYRSIEHRATVNAEKERLSIATFYGPSLYGDLGPTPSLVTPKTPVQFKRVNVVDYFKGVFARELRGKSYIDLMRVDSRDEGKNDLV